MDHQPFPHRLAKSRRLQIPKEHVQAMMHVFEASGWGLTGVGRRPVEKKKKSQQMDHLETMGLVVFYCFLHHL